MCFPLIPHSPCFAGFGSYRTWIGTKVDSLGRFGSPRRSCSSSVRPLQRPHVFMRRCDLAEVCPHRCLPARPLPPASPALPYFHFSATGCCPPPVSPLRRQSLSIWCWD